MSLEKPTDVPTLISNSINQQNLGETNGTSDRD
jgi:hypothetical protein